MSSAPEAAPAAGSSCTIINFTNKIGYIISIALAKKVIINGRVSVIIVGIKIQTRAAPTREAKNNIQNLPLDFVCVSIYSFFAKIH